MRRLDHLIAVTAKRRAMRPGLAFAILFALVITLSGCGDSTPATAIDYRRTGGIAGFDDHLTIQPGGQATLTRRGAQATFTVDQATLKQLTTLLDKAGFSRLPAESLAQRGADLFTYEITYQGRTVRTQDTAIPAALQPAIDLLNTLVQANAKP